MADIFLLLGTALCILSVIAAIISVIGLRPPRGAAILFVLGLIVLIALAVIEPGSVGFQQLGGAWNRVFG
ncbi:hypothetical protein [Paracoccus sediminicola]|uniref:hypothetical protein n=1 Tax=Paracoccus sediminicola TaxID=3017783 RepID=UPI0022F0D01B|nr:hypothetical protein [Paracoccus sediminicola]WBU57109.1 hypothetical protein PAF18_01280 [Paracoccus sediminicola]